MTKLIIEILGWIGSAEVILAYALISSNKLDAKDIRYQLLNLSGAFFLIINTYYNESYPSMGINLVWVVIAFVGILNIWKGSGRAD